MKNIVCYTAKDESPDCNKCDNRNDPLCYEYCGIDNGWYGYRRTTVHGGWKDSIMSRFMKRS